MPAAVLTRHETSGLRNMERGKLAWDRRRRRQADAVHTKLIAIRPIAPPEHSNSALLMESCPRPDGVLMFGPPYACNSERGARPANVIAANCIDKASGNYYSDVLVP